MALYTDRAHWALQYAAGAAARWIGASSRRSAGPWTRLGIEHIPAYSPQARGRSERLNRTFQDRLVNELRVAKITTLDGGQSRISPTASSRTTTRPSAARRRDPASAFVPLGQVDLEQILCHQESAPRRARQHRRVRGPHLPAGAPARPPLVRRPAGHPSASHASLDLAGRDSSATPAVLERHARSSNGRAACGSCRSRGRQERAHRCLENARTRFPQIG